MLPRKILMWVLLIGVFAWTVGGCSKVTRANYDKVETEMTMKEVTDILGNPTEKTSAGAQLGPLGGTKTSCEWKSGGKTISVEFVNDKVIAKSQTKLD